MTTTADSTTITPTLERTTLMTRIIVHTQAELDADHQEPPNADDPTDAEVRAAAPPAERNHKAEALSAAAWSILENEESI